MTAVEPASGHRRSPDEHSLGGVESPLGHRRSVNPTARVGWGMVDALSPIPSDCVGEVTIEVVDPADDDAQRCLRAYEAELNERFDAGFEVDAALPLPADDLRPPAGCFLVAYRDGEAIGCGGLKLHGPDPAEIKRVWVDRSARGLGLARRLLTELEDRARAAGAPAVQLDTNRTLTEAIALYRKTGYVEIEAFNDEPYAHHWFRKTL